MSLPISLHGEEYLNELRYYRDNALVNSHYMGRRKTIGNFAFGIITARWQTEDGGEALLTDEGLRHKTTTITKIRPTTLHLYSPIIKKATN